MLENDCYLTDKRERMKKTAALLSIVLLLISCKEEVVKKPDRLIEKEVMVNIMFDLTLLDAIKYQNPASLDTFKINPTKYVYQKYKIDSLQFARSNTYYASDYEAYAEIIDQVDKKLTADKATVTALVKSEAKKNKKKKKTVAKPVAPTTKLIDSLKIN